jgi:hypothetical protein
VRVPEIAIGFVRLWSFGRRLLRLRELSLLRRSDCGRLRRFATDQKRSADQQSSALKLFHSDDYTALERFGKRQLKQWPSQVVAPVGISHRGVRTRDRADPPVRKTVP